MSEKNVYTREGCLKGVIRTNSEGDKHVYDSGGRRLGYTQNGNTYDNQGSLVDTYENAEGLLD